MDNSNLAPFSYKMPGALLCFFRICNFVRAHLWMLPPKHSTGKIKCNSFIRAIAPCCCHHRWLAACWTYWPFHTECSRMSPPEDWIIGGEERRGIDDRWPKISSWDPEEWRDITSSCIDLIMYLMIDAHVWEVLSWSFSLQIKHCNWENKM